MHIVRPYRQCKQVPLQWRHLRKQLLRERLYRKFSEEGILWRTATLIRPWKEQGRRERLGTRGNPPSSGGKERLCPEVGTG